MSAEFEKMPVQEQAELLAQQSANEAYILHLRLHSLK